MSFSLQTGLNSAGGVLRWQGQEALLPLGARQDEFDQIFRVSSGELTENERSQWQQRMKEGVEREQKHWDIGEFVLVRSGAVYGAIEFQGEEDPTVLLFDDHWFTPQITIAEKATEGPDIILSFPIEPNLIDEPGVLRINTLTRQAVIPSDHLPQSFDIRYQVQPGIPPLDELNRLSNAVQQRVNELEQEWVFREAKAILKQVATQQACQQWSLPENIQSIWDGYALEIEWKQDRCVLDIATEFDQHRRRFQGQVSLDMLEE